MVDVEHETTFIVADIKTRMNLTFFCVVLLDIGQHINMKLATCVRDLAGFSFNKD